MPETLLQVNEQILRRPYWIRVMYRLGAPGLYLRHSSVSADGSSRSRYGIIALLCGTVTFQPLHPRRFRLALPLPQALPLLHESEYKMASTPFSLNQRSCIAGDIDCINWVTNYCIPFFHLTCPSLK